MPARPAVPVPQRPHEDRTVPLDPALPPLLREHLDPTGTGRVPLVETFALWARGRMRLGGGISLPLRFTAMHRVGEGFLHDLAITWFGLPVIPGADLFVDGRGVMRVGPKEWSGPEMDQGANLAMWGEALIAPSVFAAGSPLRAVQEDDATVRLTMPLGGGTDTAWLSFEYGRPVRFRALRHRGPGGTKEWWHGQTRDWQDVEGGVVAPRYLAATWEADGRPWLELDVQGVTLHADVDTRFAEHGRRGSR
ncbi:MAG TPA: DUF6544 family protein [Jiangellales bacterium]|nr:DUF6544 family protein [Jiangellales bacterium]